MLKDILDDLESFAADNFSDDPDLFLHVPFVPSDENIVEAMLELAEVGPKDLVYDLGSGDGRILIHAARHRDARGIGIDIDPVRVADAMELAGRMGVEYVVDFIEGDMFEVDISPATVVTLYLFPDINVRLRPRLLSELRPGTRIVSHAFDMGDWKPDDVLRLEGTLLYKWIVPAQVAGTWEWEGRDGTPFRVELKQKFQEVEGRAWRGGRPISLAEAKLQGDRLELLLRDGEAGSLESFTLKFAQGKLKSVR